LDIAQKPSLQIPEWTRAFPLAQSHHITSLSLEYGELLKLHEEFVESGEVLFPQNPTLLIHRDPTKPELLHGVPKAFHIAPPTLEEIQLPSVPSLEDLRREMDASL
jgi:hypothetical protein